MDAALLRTLLTYNPGTGVLVWLPRPGIGRNDRTGLPAGTKNKAGYIAVAINRKSYLAHRLAWLHFYGSWPETDIDHIDRNRANNAIANLRLAFAGQNNQNTARYKSNTSGCKGVYKHSWGKFEAFITKDRQRVYLGVFDTLDAARAARQKAQDEMFSHPGEL